MHSSPQHNSDLDPFNILIVDDNEGYATSLQTLLKHFLKGCRRDVKRVLTTQESLALIDSGWTPAMAFVDYTLEGSHMSSLELLTSLQAQHGIQILFLICGDEFKAEVLEDMKRRRIMCLEKTRMVGFLTTLFERLVEMIASENPASIPSFEDLVEGIDVA